MSLEDEKVLLSVLAAKLFKMELWAQSSIKNNFDLYPDLLEG